MRFRELTAGALVAGLAVASGAAAGDGGAAVEDRAGTIGRLLEVVEGDYVFPDVAREIGRTVRERAGQGAYDGLDGPGLARALTRDLRDVSRDLHLRVEYSAEPLPPEPETPGGPLAPPPPEQKEAMRRGLARMNYGLRKVEVFEENVGYLRFDLFAPVEFAADTYTAALNLVADTDALIIDLRWNSGSLDPQAVPLVCGHFFAEPVHLNDIYWRPGDRTEEFWTRAESPGRKYLDRPIYLLTSGHTFSGAEEFAYDLKNLRRATLVGETTGGGANPGGTRRVDDHFAVWLPIGRAINPISGTNWEGTGVAPDLDVPAGKALLTARREALKAIVAAEPDPGAREALGGTLAKVEGALAAFRPVTFTLRGHADAREVRVAGSFNGWSDRIDRLARRGDAWVGEVEVEPGRLTYKFVVDGEWILDPDNPEVEEHGPHKESVRVVE